MLRIRVIPILLLKSSGLIKGIKFRNHKYLGDPINTVKIFNDKGVDELIFLDIMASSEKKAPLFSMLSEICSECFMPLCYGGGIRSISDIKKLFKLGIEKVSINSFAVENPAFIKEAADIFGSQSIIVSIDVKRTFLGKYDLVIYSGSKSTGIDPVQFSVRMAEMGAGELIINSVDRDGTMSGFDLNIIEQISKSVDIPVIACGGASKVHDFYKAIKAGASAVSAGSMFVFHGPHRAVLINFPSSDDLQILNDVIKDG